MIISCEMSTFTVDEAESRVSRRWNDQIIRPGTQASSLSQMWREIEGEDVGSHSLKFRPRKSNGSDSDCLSTTTSMGQGRDSGDDISEDADENQNRAMPGSKMDHEDHISVISEQSSDLGDTAREKIRLIFRSWMNSSAKSHSPNILRIGKNSGPQYLGESECRRVRIIREWVQTNVEPSSCGSPRDGSSEVGSQIEHVREGLVINPEIGSTQRSIRRLCGRQTLIDLLLRARSERERELLRMLEQKSVSGFAHRNRIQALLRGRFLQNKRLIPNEKPSCSVTTELGLLRQSTVSDLREGFLSKLDNSSHPSANSVATDHTLADKSNSQSKSICEEGEVTDIFPASHQESALGSNQSHWDSEVQASEVDPRVLTSRRSIREASISRADSQQDRRAIGSDIECIHIGYGKSNRITCSEGPSLEKEDINQSECPEVFHEDELRSGRSEIYESINYTANLGQNGSEEIDYQDASSLQEVVQEYGVISFLEDSADPWFQQTPHNGVVEQEQMQESRENQVGHDLQADGISFDMPSNEIRASIEGIDGFYFHEDDYVHRKELRELFSRRRVSGLLGSGFRESLNRVLQSHAQRLSHASNDWELGNPSSSSVLIEQEPAQQIGDQNSNNDLHIGNWTHGSNQSLGTDNWEVENELRNEMANSDVVNELRNDIAMLQQRMNNMQSMLEACMDMQIEIQCFIRQDVSTISNRSFVSTVLPSNADSTEYDFFKEESSWNLIKKGICCLCRVTKISSLLYGCGHICLCSRCAENLVQKMGKCPICQAPVVEAVRAYFIQ
ncbi:uncharacterized protein LOC142523313 isoform X2 [Primulina tabacum]|uniref:uncharacterized protein LOC142523313 isoform X2 n=1 Tax=Primulina tabacum TaxID=48773 RepID=UPI003F59D800